MECTTDSFSFISSMKYELSPGQDQWQLRAKYIAEAIEVKNNYDKTQFNESEYCWEPFGLPTLNSRGSHC